MTSILFVCLGNICRSPAAEGIMRHLAAQDHLSLKIQSCGLGSWHVGRSPDIRMQDAAKGRGISLDSRAQAFDLQFFDDFDYILAVDNEVLQTLLRHAKKKEHKGKIYLITAFSNEYKNLEIPDPFYDNDAAFEKVLDMLEDSCEGLIRHIKKLFQKN